MCVNNLFPYGGVFWVLLSISCMGVPSDTKRCNQLLIV